MRARRSALLVRIAQDEIGLRGMAVQALIDLRAEEAAPALLPLLNRLRDSAHEEKLCCSLLFLMTAVDYRFAMPDVRAFLGHRLAGVRCAALKAVARWQDGEAVETVRQMAREDGSAFVRPAAVTALADLLGAEALPDLETLAADANSLVRGAVAEALAGMPALPPRGASCSFALAADSAAPVARIASEALAVVARRRAPLAAVEREGGVGEAAGRARASTPPPHGRSCAAGWGNCPGRSGETGRSGGGDSDAAAGAGGVNLPRQDHAGRMSVPGDRAARGCP